MMDRAKTLERSDLDPLYITILGQARVHQYVDPPVGPRGWHHLIFGQLHDEIRLAHVPRVGVLELTRRRHIGGISLWRSAVHPLDDSRDLVVGQRHIVLEVADTDVLVDVP